MTDYESRESAALLGALDRASALPSVLDTLTCEGQQIWEHEGVWLGDWVRAAPPRATGKVNEPWEVEIQEHFPPFEQDDGGAYPRAH